ncbi:MAG: hypothetical protein QMC78_01950 [Methanocellales archaeon]|nr:hypothetical protein [Methanocellales archaeon]
MTPIEIMALIVALFAGIKMLVTLINPKYWKNTVTKRSWANPTLTSLVSLVLTVVTLAFLLRELTIVQIFAVMLFAMGLIMLGFAPYSKEMLVLEDKMFKQKEKGWLAGLVWAVLTIWVLYALFA